MSITKTWNDKRQNHEIWTLNQTCGKISQKVEDKQKAFNMMDLRLERKKSTNKSHVIEFIGQCIYLMSSFCSVLPRVIQPSASSCTTRGSVSCRRTSTRRPWTSSRRWKRWVTPSQLQFTGFAGVSSVFWVRVTGLTGTNRYHIIQMAQEGLPALRWLHQGVSLGDGGLIFLFPSPPSPPADDEHLWHHDGHAGGGAQEPQHQDVAGPHSSMGPDFQHR